MTEGTRDGGEYQRWLEQTGLKLDSAIKQGIHDSLYSNSECARAYTEAEELGVDEYTYIVWKLGWDDYVDGWTYSVETGWVDRDETHQEVQEILSDVSFDEESESKQATLNDTGAQWWTADEQRIIDAVASRKGEQWAEEHTEVILAQARLVGELTRCEE